MAAAAGQDSMTEEEQRVQHFKMKKLIQSLERARGSGTSVITLILPPKSQIAQAGKMLADEYGTASNIKSRVTRSSVLSAITSVQQKLKTYSRCPNNGLIIYCGEVTTEDGKTKKLAIDFEPFKPINTSVYMCDNRFHTEPLRELLQDDEVFGFIIMDGNGCLYGTLQGNVRNILQQFSVELPKKHGRGGQSAMRFARLRLEKRHNYLRKVAENAVNNFIGPDSRPNVRGIVLAGSAEFKTELQRSDLFDNRLAEIVIKTVDISYGGENGFNQAIELSAEALSNVKFVQEKKLIASFFEEINRDTGKYCFGIKDTMTALEMSAVEKLILWEELDIMRTELRNPSTGETTVAYVREGEEHDRSEFEDSETGVELELVSQEPLIDWFTENYKDFGTSLEFVTDRSQEGAQFVRGFGGIGGILRWKVDFMEMAEFEDDDDFI